MIRQYWQHKTSGEVYAVELESDGAITGCSGPLHHTEVGDLLAHNYDSEDVDWLTANADDFTLAEGGHD